MSERIYERESDTLLKPKEEIVRCKDCKYFNDGDCTELPKIVSETDYCSFAERKEQ